MSKPSTLIYTTIPHHLINITSFLRINDGTVDLDISAQFPCLASIFQTYKPHTLLNKRNAKFFARSEYVLVCLAAGWACNISAGVSNLSSSA